MKNKASSILIIEDNPATVSVLYNLLNEAEFEVLIALDGDNAIKSAEEGQPDIILLDVILCGMDGFEICHRLKTSETTRNIPVLFMTALTKTVDKVKGFELGAVDYITKPFEPEEVLARVKTHLMIQQLQRDLQQKNEELHAALDRERKLNNLKSRFISIASHEFRTPLASILFSKNLLQRYTQKLSEKEFVGEMGEELISIERSVHQMTAVLDEVLTITKTEAGKVTFTPERIDLTELCRDIVEKFRSLSTDAHTLIFPNSGDHIHVLADPKLMETILSNLLSNAIKYSPRGGTVYCSLWQDNGTIRLSIKDEGIGIAEDDQSHLFEAFYRGANAAKIKGTGLGLSIVKQFIELHGGAIEVKSEVNRGTTFTIVLPLPSQV
jgi:two-component system sensor histidine kinase/response regulator